MNGGKTEEGNKELKRLRIMSSLLITTNTFGSYHQTSGKPFMISSKSHSI